MGDLLTQGHPSLPLNSGDHSCLLALTIPLSNLAVTARKLKDGKEKKFNPAPLEQGGKGRRQLWLQGAQPPCHLPPSSGSAPEPATGPCTPAQPLSPFPGQRLPWTGRVAGCWVGKMLCHSELEGIPPGEGKGREKEDPTHTFPSSAPNPNLATALEKPDPSPDPRRARRARPGMLISALSRAPGKHCCGRPPAAWRGHDPSRPGLGAASSPCAPRSSPRRLSTAAAAGAAVPPAPAPCPAAPLRRMGVGG